ncbi:MAG: aldo/keto reductase [Ectothiorhodospiraceae bacterium]|nr:aldo/keto reductase [Chromatiales bacterium]MCP5157376.1 aldo/keto reductase [Ectothiorhodospiraceae bacterium]
MDTRKFGNTGLEVTRIGFGAMTIGGAFGPVDDTESTQALHAAIDAGMNFIDTSNAYGEGRSETLIGQFLRSRPDRDRILVFTKGGNNMVTRVRNFEPDYIASCLEGSLSRLGRDTIDFYMLHNPSVDNMAAEDSYAVLEKAKSDGKIRHWGVSVNTVAECELAVSQGRVAAMQMEYNILNQSAGATFSSAHAAGLGVISRVPLNRGFLSGRFDETVQWTDDDTRKRSLTPENIRKHQGQLDLVRSIAAEMGISPAALAIRFCASNPDVSCVIPGVRTASQARQNAAAWEPLPEDVMARLRAA